MKNKYIFILRTKNILGLHLTNENSYISVKKFLRTFKNSNLHFTVSSVTI